MNKFKATKYKTESLQNDSSIFDKISKRYSNVRFLRKSTNRKEPQTITGSYDMTGRNSDDHKLEIGAPILISKTTIDTDSIIDANQFRHSMISTMQRSSNESDVYHDANSSLDTQQSTSIGDLKLSSTDEDDTTYTKRRTLPTTIEVNNNNGTFVGNRSRSATNLHKTELSVYIQRSPSMELSQKFTTKRVLSKHSIDSDVSFNNSRNTVNDLIYDEEQLDFDMKSASFQSLNARNIFLSIEELNEITRQINESDDFHVDNEYQKHRENLRPCERRVTLLRNKNHPKFLNIAPKRDKLTNAWSGFKTWIGEEKGKIKEVVNKHAAMQRVGANRTSIDPMIVDGVTVVNGTALQITQPAIESSNDQQQQQQSLQQDSIDRTSFNDEQRKVIGSENNDIHQNAAMMKGKSLHELEVKKTKNSSSFKMGFLLFN